MRPRPCSAPLCAPHPHPRRARRALLCGALLGGALLSGALGGCHLLSPQEEGGAPGAVSGGAPGAVAG
ncbi:MAG: hypothetical protein FJ138_15935, partial [Deltaproteobacteria bacterium]|nr:hypothetical protein [Deltaproteobacteria bacterium]